MSASNPACKPCSRAAGRSVLARGARTFPPDIALLWPLSPSLVGVKKSAVGPDLTWSYTGPMYDGDGVSIGANPPFHSGKGVYGGPAVTNFIPNPNAVGASIGGVPTGWTSVGSGPGLSVSCVNFGHGFVDVRYSGTPAGTYCSHLIGGASAIVAASGQTWTAYVTSQLVSGSFGNVKLGYFRIKGALSSGALVEWVDAPLSLLSFDAFYSNKITLSNAASVRIGASIEFGLTAGLPVDFTLRFSRPMISNSPFVLPYVCPNPGQIGVTTQPSAAATTGGNGLNVLMDRKILEALRGKDGAPAVCTVMHEAYMGVGSGDVVIDTSLVSCRNVVADVVYVSSGGVLKSSDGVNTATVTVAGGWSAGTVLFPVVRANGTQFQIGYRKAGETSFTWGALTTFRGTFGPLTTVRACLNNTYPIWARKIATERKFLSEAETDARSKLVRY